MDLDAYLARIGLRDRPSFAAMHRAHVCSITFENLDPASGLPASLDPDHLEDKLVRRGRGGYCFEHNLLLKMAAEALGVDEVTPMLARVRIGGDGSIRPRSHLVLRVVADGRAWHADVGFGGDGPLDPLPFGPGPEVEQDGWRYQVVEDGRELVLRTWRDDGWVDLYGFVPEPAPLVDIQTSNWYVSTWPNSPFVNGLIVAAISPEARLSLLSSGGEGSLVERRPDVQAQITPLALEEVPSLLATSFALPGVSLGADRRFSISGPAS